jgi:hypothetical protein
MLLAGPFSCASMSVCASGRRGSAAISDVCGQRRRLIAELSRRRLSAIKRGHGAGPLCAGYRRRARRLGRRPFPAAVRPSEATHAAHLNSHQKRGQSGRTRNSGAVCRLASSRFGGRVFSCRRRPTRRRHGPDMTNSQVRRGRRPALRRQRWRTLRVACCAVCCCCRALRLSRRLESSPLLPPPQVSASHSAL